MAMVVVVVAVVLLVLLGVGCWIAFAWRRYARSFEVVAERLFIDSRLEQLTAQTLAAMREVARRDERFR